MGLKATRKILCFLLTVIIAASTFFGAFFAVTANTYGKQSFYENNWCDDELAEQCEQQLDSKLSALSYKSGIPLEVFNAVKRDTNTKTAVTQAVTGLFIGSDSTLYSQSRVEYFYSLCELYLKANGYNYSKDDVMNVAEEAAQIYSDSLGIHNAQTLKSFAEKKQVNSSVCAALCSIVGLICIALLIMLYREKHEGFVYIGSSVAAGGIAQLLMSLSSLIFGFNAHFDVLPVAYEQVFIRLHDAFMFYNALCGVALTALGVAVFAVAQMRISAKNNRASSGYYNVIGNM